MIDLMKRHPQAILPAVIVVAAVHLQIRLARTAGYQFEAGRIEKEPADITVKAVFQPRNQTMAPRQQARRFKLQAENRRGRIEMLEGIKPARQFASHPTGGIKAQLHLAIGVLQPGHRAIVALHLTEQTKILDQPAVQRSSGPLAERTAQTIDTQPPLLVTAGQRLPAGQPATGLVMGPQQGIAIGKPRRLFRPAPPRQQSRQHQRHQPYNKQAHRPATPCLPAPHDGETMPP